jgi:hypothetical protein
MRKLYFLLSLTLLYSSLSIAQTKLDLRSPDKQKYLGSGAVIGGACYSLYFTHFTQNANRTNASKVKIKSFIASNATVLGLTLIKEVYDYKVSGFNINADDYGLDLASALLGCLSVNICIPLLL